MIVVSRKSLRWDWRLEASLNRKANGLALEGPFCGTLRTFVGLTPINRFGKITRRRPHSRADHTLRVRCAGGALKAV